jgi:hypothetical protein
MNYPRSPRLWLLSLGPLTVGCASTPSSTSAPPAALPPNVATAPSVVRTARPMMPEKAETAATHSSEARAAVATGTNCVAEPKLRERAYCYLQSDAEASIAPLFAVGRAMVKEPKYPTAAWQDFTYAAENAGVLAAKTSDAQLHAGLQSADETDPIFAIRALGHMLSILRMGYGAGGDADSVNRKLRLAPAHAACLATLSARDERLLRAGGDCLKEIGEPSDVSPLIDAVLARADAPKQQAFLVDVLASVGRVPEAGLRKLVPILEQPLSKSWSHDELYMRSRICQMMLNTVRGQRWAMRAGAAAVGEIGNRNSQAREPCERLSAERR